MDIIIILKGLLFVVSFYLVLGVYGIFETYMNRENWIPEFKELMENGGILFKLNLFFQSPISITRRMFY